MNRLNKIIKKYKEFIVFMLTAVVAVIVSTLIIMPQSMDSSKIDKLTIKDSTVKTIALRSYFLIAKAINVDIVELNDEFQAKGTAINELVNKSVECKENN